MTTALVVGAGIGGLSAAAALANAGLTVEVFERTPNPRELGFALLLAPNAMAALRELGIADTVLARGALLRRGQIRRGDGRVLKAIEFSKIRASLGEETVCVLRPVLHGALLERVGREGLHLGALVTGYRTGKAGVELAAAGEPTVHGDLLVGADGVGSAIRRALHPLEPPPRRRGILAFRGVARNGAADLDGQDAIQYLGRGYELGLARANASDVYWYASIAAEEPPAAEASPRGRLERHLAAFDTFFRRLVEQTADEDLRLDDLLERAPLSRWGTGPVTLLGDAAHPMLPHAGQGAAQAIEDAVVLGRAFRGADTVERALRTYERLRIPRTRAITRLSARNARLGSIRHPLVCWLRDEVIRAAPPAAILRAQVAIGRPPKHLWGDDERNAPTRSKRSALSETQDG